MTFLERYNQETTWQGRVIVMEIYHLTMMHREKNWTITKTAESFMVSIGLVSENLRLAQALHTTPQLLEIPLRQDALKHIDKRKEVRSGTSSD